MWHGTLSNLYNVVTDVRPAYGKPVVMVETAYPFTSANADSEGNSVTTGHLRRHTRRPGRARRSEFTAVQNTARNAGAIGVFYWEPTWYAIPGNGWDPANINGTGDGWDNMAVFNWTGQVNPNVRWSA